jgi:hypothetical protein
LTCQASKSPFYTVDSTRWRLGWDESRLAPDIDEEIRRSYFRFGCRGFRSRRPSPPPFSAMNSIPARSKAARIASTAPRETSRRSFSKSTTVESPRPAACASCDCVIPSSPRAARHWAGVILSTFIVDMPPTCRINNFCWIEVTGTTKPTKIGEISERTQRKNNRFNT